MIRYTLRIYKVGNSIIRGNRTITQPFLNSIRLYSDDNKYKSIEEFNKHKKQYSFGHNFSGLDELDNESKAQQKIDTKSSELHERMPHYQEPSENDIDSTIESDPRLTNLEAGSPEYKYQQHLIQQEYQKREKKERERFEFLERLKGVGVGVLALVSIISIHQIAMNYEYIKNKILHGFTYDMNETKAKDLSDPSKNTKNIDYLVSKLTDELTDELINNLGCSKDISGLYVFGKNNKFPMRVKFFDGMLIKDVKILNDYLVVINDRGELYQVYKGEPNVIKLPFKVSKSEISRDFIYLLTNKGEVVYLPRLDKQITNFTPSKSRNWFGAVKENNFGKVEVNEPVSDISSGDDHLLMLNKKGRLFIVNTSEDVRNFGQFGLPSLSPYSENKQIPVNIPFELTSLNNETINYKDGSKSIKPRIFTNIATGKFHNIVSDSNANIWTWGKNTYGECGVPISYKTDIQPIPKMILTIKDYSRIIRNCIQCKPEDLMVEKVYAADESSYIKLKHIDNDKDNNDQHILICFGNGIKGQLGINRYLHTCSQPQVIKSLSNLSEFNEDIQQVTKIGIKDISVGNNHLFITLNNHGYVKDVLAFGDNGFGQFGNGKIVKSSKPIQLPKLIEPEDLENNDKKSIKELARKINDVVTSRLQLLDGHKLLNGDKIEQVIVAGDNCSAIYYKRR